MKQILRRSFWISELKIAFTLALAFFSVDGAAMLLRLYNGDFSRDVFYSLGIIAIQSCVRALLTLLFPHVFNHGQVPSR
jgi:hypothetical protein